MAEERTDWGEDFSAQSLENFKTLLLDDEKAERWASFFSAFSDATRLKIIHVLKKEELCVHELSSLLNAKQSGISQHLKILWQQRVVKRRKVGLHVFYSVDDSHLAQLIEWGKKNEGK